MLNPALTCTERKKKLMEENHHQMELLKEQADQLEKEREKRKHLEVGFKPPIMFLRTVCEIYKDNTMIVV